MNDDTMRTPDAKSGLDRRTKFTQVSLFSVLLSGRYDELLAWIREHVTPQDVGK